MYRFLNKQTDESRIVDPRRISRMEPSLRLFGQVHLCANLYAAHVRLIQFNKHTPTETHLPIWFNRWPTTTHTTQSTDQTRDRSVNLLPITHNTAADFDLHAAQSSSSRICCDQIEYTLRHGSRKYTKFVSVKLR